MAKRIVLDNINLNMEALKSEVINNQRKAYVENSDKSDIVDPLYNEDDNRLCLLIKDFLVDHPVDLKTYIHRFANPQELSNMKSSLDNNRTMTWERFQRWCYILGIDHNVTMIEVKENPEEVDDTIPAVVEGDNLMNVMIKEYLATHKINLKDRIDLFANAQELSNMKSSLKKNATMTWERFERWCDIIGLEATITISAKKNNDY